MKFPKRSGTARALGLIQNPAKSTLLEDFRGATRIQGAYVRETFNLKNNS